MKDTVHFLKFSSLEPKLISASTGTDKLEVFWLQPWLPKLCGLLLRLQCSVQCGGECSIWIEISDLIVIRPKCQQLRPTLICTLAPSILSITVTQWFSYTLAALSSTEPACQFYTSLPSSPSSFSSLTRECWFATIIENLLVLTKKSRSKQWVWLVGSQHCVYHLSSGKWEIVRSLKQL